MSSSTTQVRPEQAHDEAVAELYTQLAAARLARKGKEDTLMSLAGFKQHYFGHQAHSRAWAREKAGDRYGKYMVRVTLEDALAAVDELGADHYDLRVGKSVGEAKADLVEADRQIKTIRDAIDEKERAYTGWARFFLVTSSAGHVHSSMSCSTCRPTTVYGWLPNLSGRGEKEAVDELGPALCSVCFPSAPVEWQGGTLSTGQAADILAGRPVRQRQQKTYCAGSGQVPSATRGRYGSCASCGGTFATTQYGVMRKHEAVQS